MLRFLFGFEDRVDRRAYFTWGVSLMALKYAGEWGANRLLLQRPYSVLQFLNPFFSGKFPQGESLVPVYLGFLAIWSIPFLWIGVGMSVRRAADAGASPWLGLLFFAPGLNFLLMLALSVAPTRSPERWSREHRPRLSHDLTSALGAIAIAAAYGLAVLVVAVAGRATYGAGLFLGTPFVLGAAAAYLYNRATSRTARDTGALVTVTLLALAGLAVLFAFEGVICLVMAIPVVLPCALLGAMLGRQVALRWRGPSVGCLAIVLVLPPLSLADRGGTELARYEVRTTIAIAAPPETVWKRVLAFPELAPPTEWYFRAGIAYPMRARLEGRGVGATRYCEFSTGSFVEPITRWEEGKRLSFDVAFNPAPMRELSPHEQVYAPHLDGYLRSRAGEFRLVALPDGGTRLEGSTWYELDIHPNFYWKPIADAIIGRIHRRVLEHIKRTAERG